MIFANIGEIFFNENIIIYIFKRAENIVAKGENAGYEQLLILPHLFQKSSAAEASESGCMWGKVNNLPDIMPPQVEELRISAPVQQTRGLIPGWVITMFLKVVVVIYLFVADGSYCYTGVG